MNPNSAHSITRLSIVPACTTWTHGRPDDDTEALSSILPKKECGAQKKQRCGSKDCWILVLGLSILIFCAMAVALGSLLILIHDKVNEITDGLGDGRFPSMDEVGALTKVLVETTASAATSISKIASDTQMLIQESSVTLLETLNTTQHTVEGVDRLVSHPPDIKFGRT